MGDVPEASKPCVNISGCMWSAAPWGPCSNVCGNGMQFRSVTCANGREEDCRRHAEPPKDRQTCQEMSGCGSLQAAPSCQCMADDPTLAAAGALNAASGYLVSFVILHEMVTRVSGMRMGAAALLSCPAVLLAGIGALAASSVLRSGLTVTVEANQKIVSSTQLTIGLVGLALWTLSLCGLGALSWTSPKPVNCASATVLAAFCGMVMFMSVGYPSSEAASPSHIAPHGFTGLSCFLGSRQ